MCFRKSLAAKCRMDGEEGNAKWKTEQLGDCCTSSVAVRVRNVIYVYLEKLEFLFKIKEL